MAGISDLISGPHYQEVGVAQGKIKPSMNPDEVAGFQERKSAVLGVFEELGLDRSMNFEEISAFLNQKAMKNRSTQFDLDSQRSIFRVAGKNDRERITPEEFANAYLQMEKNLLDEVKHYRRKIYDDTKASESTNRKLIQARPKQELNQYNIMVGSHLQVTVHGATNLSQSIGSPVVKLS